MFAGWHRVREGTWSRPRFWREMRPLRRRVEQRLRRGAQDTEGKTAATCRDLVQLATALWTFIDVPGVEPTNNAERALRPAVSPVSLCPSFSSTRNGERAGVAGIAIRAALTRLAAAERVLHVRVGRDPWR
jgi:hypothetical protein